MRKLLLLTLVASLFGQTPPGQTTNPVQKVNVQWVNGVSPGYWAKKTTGLNLSIGSGVVNCNGAISTYNGSTVAVADNAVSYGYLDSGSSCAPTLSTTQPACNQWLFAKVTASNGQITEVLDTRLSATYCTGGAPGKLTFTPTPIDFGSIQSGQTSFPVNLTISNTGDGLVVVTDATLSGDPFSSPSLNICNTDIVGGASCTLPLTCVPSTTGSVDGTITFTSTAAIDPASPLVVPLHCTGTSGATYLLSVNGGAGSGSGSVVSDESTPLINATFNAGSPSGVISNNYAAGSTPILTATPSPGSILSSFTVDGTPCASPCTVTVNAAVQVAATFNLTPPNFNLTLQGAGQGTGSATSNVSANGGLGVLNCISTSGVVSSGGTSGCNGSFPQGTVVTLHPVPSGTDTFAGWIGYPSCTTGDCTVTMNANITLTMNFAKAATSAPISLTQTSTNCSVTGTTVGCNWASPQLAADFNVCAVSWPDNTTTVSSFTDTTGNTYTKVTGASSTVAGLSQSIYYSQNIGAAAGGANTTTATLSTSVATSISGSNLTSGNSATPGTTFTTASVTPTTNRLVLITVTGTLASGNGPGAISTITGNGLTWVKVTSVSSGNVQGSGKAESTEVWRALGTASAGAITITYTASPTNVSWIVDQFANVDTSGTNGSGAIGNISTNSGSGASPATVTMGTFGSSANGTYGALGSHGSTTNTQNGSMTLLAKLATGPTVLSEWAAARVSPVTTTYGGNENWGIIGLEIKVPVSRRDMRCAEYGGIKTSGDPVDTSAVATGTSAAPSSGGVTTGTANDLLTGWTASTTSVNTASAGYIQRIKNSFGDDGEDQQGVVVGTYPFAPALTTSGTWVASQAAFLAQSTSAPTVFSLSLTGAGNGAGTVVGNAGTPIINAGINAGVCSGSCSSSVSSGTTVTITAQPLPGSVFAGWSGVTGCSSSAVCDVPNITSNQSIRATFTLAAGQNYYVNGSTGSDSNSGLCAVAGTPAGCSGPWLTIAKATSSIALGPGGSCGPANGWTATVNGIGACIHIAAATYSNPQTLSTSGVSGQRVRYLSETKYGARLTAMWSVTGSFIDVVGFEMDGTGLPGLVNGMVGYGNDDLFLSNELHDLASGCNSINSAVLESASAHPAGHGNVYDSNLIYHNNCGVAGSSANGAGNTGISTHAWDAVKNNIVLDQGGGWCAQTTHTSTNIVFTNNTMAACGNGALIVGSTTLNDYSTYTNNILINSGAAGNNGGLRVYGSGGCGPHNIYKNNLMYGNTPSNYIFDSGCTNTATGTQSGSNSATFVTYTGTGAGDYHLKTGSTGIDTGTTQCASGVTGCTPMIDYDGIARPQGPAFDIGALESH